MKPITYKDSKGFLHRVLIKDSDSDDAAPYGLPVGPDIRSIDWDKLIKEINNVLVKHEVFSWRDAQHKPVGFSAAMNILKRHLIALYRQDNQ